MRLRYWTALGGTALLGLTAALQLSRVDVPTELKPLASSFDKVSSQNAAPAFPPDTVAQDPPLIQWSRAIKAGESLDRLLTDAAMPVAERAEVSRLIGAQYDLRKLKPGHIVTVSKTADGVFKDAVLEVENGLHIHVVLGDNASVRSYMPEGETYVQAAEAHIGSSIYAALEKVRAPSRFATDLELIFAETLDLRRSITGGEILRIVWRENRIDDRVVGDPVIDFAQFEVAGDTYEVIWPDENSARNVIFKNGQIMHVFRQPVAGGRLSSAFGLRTHPIHGGKRMHKGVDFAATEGDPVVAIYDGRVTFSGPKSGYGFLIELAHEDGVLTRYGHLSGAVAGLKVGQQVSRGEHIGDIGSTGTSTAPHLHYEILVNGQHVSPLNYEWPRTSISPEKRRALLSENLNAAREELTQALDAASGKG